MILHSNVCYKYLFIYFCEKCFEIKKAKYYQAKYCQEYVMFEKDFTKFTFRENERHRYEKAGFCFLRQFGKYCEP